MRPSVKLGISLVAYKSILLPEGSANRCSADLHQPEPLQKFPKVFSGIFLFVSLLLCLPASPSADEIWRWTDKENVVHFTDIRLSVPTDYRETATGLNYFPTKVFTTNAAQKNKVSTVGEKKRGSTNLSNIRRDLVSHLKHEIARDSYVITWVNNELAINKMKELFLGDLAIKNRFINNIAEEDNKDLQNELEWLAENISMERQIIGNLPEPVPGKLYLFTGIKKTIKKNLRAKQDFLLTLEMN